MNLELDKQRLLKHLEEDIYCKIGVSKIHGVGVIAIKDIPHNTNPFNNLSTYKKEKIINLTNNDLKYVNKNVVKILGDFFDGTGSGVYNILYEGPNYINISFYMNHSSNPNIIPVDIPELSNFYSFITSRDIKEGEELTFDYTKFADNDIINNTDINNNLKYYKFNTQI